MSDPSADQIVAAIVVRDELHVPADEYTRLVGIYAELQPQLATLRSPEVRYAEPAIIYPASPA
jgi:hypothetical protein